MLILINSRPLHTRDWDHYTSSTLIGGEGRASPNSLHTTLEGPAEYVNARLMESLHGFLHGIELVVFHGHLDYFHKPPLTTMALQMLIPIDLLYFIMCEDSHE